MRQAAIKKEVVLKVLSISIALFTADSGYAAAAAKPKRRLPAQQCQAVKWPFSVNERNFTPKELEKVDRSSLYAFLYYELGAQKSARTPKLAEKLFFYLINTETSEPKAKLLEAIQGSADLNSSNPNIIGIEELCSFEARLPNSTKPKEKK